MIFRRIRQRLQSKEALRADEQRFRAIFEQAVAGIVVVTPDGTISEVNESFGRLVGYSAEELRRMNDPTTTRPSGTCGEP